MRRVIFLAACASIATIASVQAQTDAAVPCNKGIFWPFVRSPGDCLTDVEKRNGQTGVYGNPNVAAPAATAPAPIVQAAPAAPAPVAAPAPSAQPAPPAAPVVAAAPGSTAAKAGVPPRSGFNFFGLFGSDANAPPAAAPAAPAPAVPSVAAAPASQAGAPIAQAGQPAPCTKGWFWPFSRSAGDCLTDVEKRNGQTGVYGNPNAVASVPAPAFPAQAAPAPARAAPAAAPPVAAAAPVAAAPAPIAAAPAAGALVAGNNGEVPCTKGWFWPFSRSTGDCLTDVEIKNGQTGVYGNPNVGGRTGAQSAVALAPPPQEGSSFFGLFGNDTPRETAGTRGLLEDSFAPAPVFASTPGGANIAPSANNVASLAAPAAAPVVTRTDQAVPCNKGWFWPFSRSTGDCLTDVERANGQTGVYGNPNAQVASLAAAPPAPPAPAAAPAQAPAIVPAAPAAASAPAIAAPIAQADQAAPCTKGWFWPFSRSAGDCLTDVEKKNGQTGVYGNPNAVASLVTPAPAPTPPAQPSPAAASAVIAAPATPAAAPAAQTAVVTPANQTAAGCTKGWFWPFARSPGDCLTDVERRNGQTGVYGNPAGAAAPVPAAATPPPAPQGERSFLGIFGLGSAQAAGTPAPQPASAPAAAPARQDAVVTRTEADGAACTKGWFWPFVREPGDCPTDAERRNAAQNGRAAP